MGGNPKPSNPVKKWLVSVALKKLIKRLVQVLVALITGPKIAPWLASLGITVDPTALTAGIYGLLELLRNWLKVRFGWGWL